jgi:hypothetical protein
METQTCTQPICLVCRTKDCFNFNVPDWLWEKVVPQEKQNGVICLCCFDELAKEKAVSYSDHLRKLYFAGQQAQFEFEVVNAS